MITGIFERKNHLVTAPDGSCFGIKENGLCNNKR